MARVKLAAKLPDDETKMNGLDVIARELIKDPHSTHLVVGVVDAAATTVDHRKGDAKTPTAGMVQIEVVKIPRDVGLVKQVLDRAFAQRNGQPTPKLFDVDELGEMTDTWLDRNEQIEEGLRAYDVGKRIGEANAAAAATPSSDA